MSIFKKIAAANKKSNKSETVTVQEAILKLRATEEMLVKKQEFLEMKIKEELLEVKKNGKSNKRLAMQALKRKINYEKQLQQLDGTLTTLEMQRAALETANTNNAVLEMMKLANEAMKSIHMNTEVDDVQGIIDDIAEQQDVAQEIADSLSSPITFGNHLIDEDELERELGELDQEDLDRKLLDTGPIDLPDIPMEETTVFGTEVQNEPEEEKENEDEELKKLQQWAE